MHDTATGRLALARRCLAAFTTYKAIGPGIEPTPEQRAALAGWAGWGALADAVDVTKRPRLTGGWKEISDVLLETMSPVEVAAAKEATATSYYTPPSVIAAMWDILTGLGFPGGRVLEPGCGSGRFIAATPPHLRERVQWTGVEIDPTSAGIARILHPHAKIINKPLEKVVFKERAFTAAIGNVPFAEVQPFDPHLIHQEVGGKLSLHNYFLWRAVRNLHPGGVAILVTSRYTMDAENPAARRFIARWAEFVGAIRLPTGGLGEATDVVADIIVLRRRAAPYGPQDEIPDDGWLEATRREELRTSLSTYWDTHPHMVLGTLAPKGGAYHGHTLEVTPGDRPLSEGLDGAVRALVEEARREGRFWYGPDAPGGDGGEEDTVPAEKEGSFHLHPDGSVTQVIDGQHVRVPKPGDELRHLILLRDAAVELFAADADLSKPDADVEPTRAHARRLYEQYVAAYGPLNRCKIVQGPVDEETGIPTLRRITPPMGGFRGTSTKPSDPDLPTVLALEVYDEEEGTARPSEILLRRVNRRPRRITRTESPAEAISVCLDQHGRIVLKTIADLLGCPVEEVPARCGGLLYEDPETLQWVTADEYLSGPVRDKLRAARAAAENDPGRWGRNVAALEAVQPADLEPSQIEARLGSPWIPAEDVAEFIRALFNLRPYDKVEVRHEPYTASWEVTAPAARRKVEATTAWGTERYNAIDLIQLALNGGAPTVYDTIVVHRPDGTKSERRVRNHAETQLAEARLDAIQEKFKFWLWCDPGRASRLCERYNQVYNNYRPRQWDGSWLTFPGMAAGLTPYKHQRDVVARMVSEPAVAVWHPVGAGKTWVMAMGAMTLKRLGLISKAVAVVPKHLLEQAAAEFVRLYPTARVLMVTPADLTPARRRYFAAKCAAASWDIVVMTREQFTSIPVSPEVEAQFVEEQIYAYERALTEAGPNLGNGRTAKRIAKQVMNLRARHQKLLHRKEDTGLVFDQLGIDFVMVDEIHYYKNLYTPTRMEGFSLPASKRAEHLYMVTGWLRQRNPNGRCLAGFTGTPLSNTLAEGHVWMRLFLPPWRLEQLGLPSFDAFGGQFIQYETRIEVKPDGSGFRAHRRPYKFHNRPELRLIFAEFADIRTRESLGITGPRPQYETVAVDPQPELKGVVADLAERADAILRGKPKKIWSKSSQAEVDDAMVVVCTEGRKAALWLPLVGVQGTGPCKLDVAADNIARIWRQWKDHRYPEPDSSGEALFSFAGEPGAFQLVFMDLGTPRPGDGQAYGYLRDRLVQAGIPRHMIRFAQDYETPEEKRRLYKDCREGRVAVLVTSTEKGGTGVNVQDRLVAIHHVDAPWRPADVEQREGRGLRPGNRHDTVLIYRYVTTGSFDAYMWQTLERKAAAFGALISEDPNLRTVVDALSEQALDCAAVKAVATGQPLLMELADVEAEVARLRNLAAAHERNRTLISERIRDMTRMAAICEANSLTYEEIARVAPGAPRTYRKRTGSVPVADRDAVAAILAEEAREAFMNAISRDAGEWRGVKIGFTSSRSLLKSTVTVSIGANYYHMVEIGDVQIKAVRGKETLSAKPSAVINLIDKAIDEAAARVGEEEERAAWYREQVAELRPKLNEPFPQQRELDDAVRRRARIKEQIEAEAAAVEQAAAAVEEAEPQAIAA